MSDHVDDDDSIVTVEDLRQLRRQRDEARRLAEDATNARQRAERERDEARGTVGDSVKARFDAEDASLDAGIAAAEAEAEALTERIASLNAEGSFTDAAKAHRQLAKAEATITNLNARKDALKIFRAQAEEQAKQQRAASQTNNNMTSRQNQWIADHPLFNENTTEGRRYQAKINAAHHAAVADGVAIDSEEYYERLDEAHEDFAGAASGDRRQRQQAVDRELPAPADRRAPSQMPVTRHSPSTSRNGSGPVRLSPDMREAADMTFPDVPVDDYVENGVTKPGRYRQYLNFQQQLKAQGRMG